MADNKILNWFYNLPIRRKQFIGLFASEVISIVGLVGVGSILIITGGRNALINQAKSELGMLDINYNIKIDQMGFGFRGQSDNAAIIAAAKNHLTTKTVQPALRQQVKQILQNEVKAREIEYATLVGKDLKIIANANKDRTGEIFNPNNLVGEVLRNPQQIKTSEIISWSEIAKESPPIPPGMKKQQALIRYTVTPVKDPQSEKVIGALVSGDIVNHKLPIVNQTLLTQNGGYSAVYLHPSPGKFEIATSSLEPKKSSKESSEKPQKNENLYHIPLPNTTILQNAIATPGNFVNQRITIKNQTYTMVAKTISDFNGNPVAILVRGTPENDMNTLLQNSLILQAIIACLALAIDMGLAILLGKAIANPIKKLQAITRIFSHGNLSVRSDIITQDEMGELAASFNYMAEQVEIRNQTINQQMEQLQETINKLNQTQSQLIQTEKISSLGQMVTGITHAINQPINSIYGNINDAENQIKDLLLLEKFSQKQSDNLTLSTLDTIEEMEVNFLQSDLPKLLSSMKTKVKNISETITFLQNFSQFDKSELRIVDLHQGIDSTLMILNYRLNNQAELPKIKLIKEYGNLPPVECYPSQMNQVFMNLLSNAIDAIEEAMDNDEWETGREPQICIYTQATDNNWVTIHIMDNGLGINEEISSQVFDPLFTTKSADKHTGLGLSISNHIVVEKHGGEIICDSIPGKGTKFVINIPVRNNLTVLPTKSYESLVS